MNNINQEWDYFKKCSTLLLQNNTVEAQKLITHVMPKIISGEYHETEMWTSLLESIGFYPYINKYKDIFTINDTSSLICNAYFSSDKLDHVFFHKEQKKVLNAFFEGKNIILSAPTSFGKSMLIEEIVATNEYSNILIIQPTLALLDEPRKKMHKYSENYNIVVYTSQAIDSTKKCLYLFTAERALEYAHFSKIDLCIIDEFYKISKTRDDERSDVLNNAFHKVLSQFNSRFILLGPNIDDISAGFAERYNAVFIKSSYSLVSNYEIDIYKEHESQFGDRGAKKEYKKKILFELLLRLKDTQTLVFCSSPNRAKALSYEYSQFLSKHSPSQKELSLPLVDWLSFNYDPRWNIIDILRNGIGVHDGSLPKHILSSTIDYFNEKTINTVFCTSTIIEGVNTNALNVVYYDNQKGNRKKIDYFDYSNIKGRAGRMMVHFEGYIYNFNKPPKAEKTIVDFPFFDQTNMSDEILIHLEPSEVLFPNSEQNIYIQSIPEEKKELFKKNGVSVKGQDKILEEMLNINNYEKINWTRKPSYEQLAFVLSLAWNNLLKKNESTYPVTLPKLIKLTFDYGNNLGLKKLILNNYQYRVDKGENSTAAINNSINELLQIIRHWMQYKVPKWLNVLHSLQEYACKKNNLRPGNYLFYASTIENDSVPDHAKILLEYNIPSVTISKILHLLDKDLTDQALINFIRKNKIYESNILHEYEKQLFRKNLF